ncbi:type II secretion system protein [Marinobacter bryozoorum]|uniref:type II secretion system protein n=1 Tax=Marinobacter bryozoorum TaxID=256324 RepID=UPI0020047118|nr:type II secretion system protein [Marinobacter bryozoorum]MCK7544289.1 type II secretion system protein [Marinobacter bryozoorum]
MTIVIISIAISGVVGAFSLIAARSADPLNQTRAIALSQLYFDEILSRKYEQNTPDGGVPREEGCSIGPEIGESDREDFNDVDDYDGLDESPPLDADGNPVDPAYQNFRVQVAVACAGDNVGLPADDAKRITITVTDPSDNEYVFAGYRGNF